MTTSLNPICKGMCDFVYNPETKKSVCMKCGFVSTYVCGCETCEEQRNAKENMKDSCQNNTNLNIDLKGYFEQKKLEEEKSTFDVVQKPYHYNVGIEVYAYIKSWKMGYEAGNIIKYVTRYPYKDSKKRVQDLEKAKWYLERLIELEKEKEEERNNDSK